MGREISWVDFVLMVLITCGKKAVVVNVAAAMPIRLIRFIIKLLVKKDGVQPRAAIYNNIGGWIKMRSR